MQTIVSNNRINHSYCSGHISWQEDFDKKDSKKDIKGLCSVCKPSPRANYLPICPGQYIHSYINWAQVFPLHKMTHYHYHYYYHITRLEDECWFRTCMMIIITVTLSALRRLFTACTAIFRHIWFNRNAMSSLLLPLVFTVCMHTCMHVCTICKR